MIPRIGSLEIGLHVRAEVQLVVNQVDLTSAKLHVHKNVALEFELK